MLTFSRLINTLHYDPDLGKFRRRDTGKITGTPMETEYEIISIDGRRYLAHRLAFFYVNGRWPKEEIDHINGIRGDNRIYNLREASRKENARNRKRRHDSACKYKGTCFNKKIRKYHASIMIGGKQRHLGVFVDEVDAAKAYDAAAKKAYGEFCKINFP